MTTMTTVFSRCTRCPTHALALAASLVAVSAVADPTATLRQCREVKDSMARLACYDAISLSSTAAVGGSTASTLPAGAPAPSPEASFGLPARPAPAAGADALNSAIAGVSNGWGPSTRFTLTNGQIWQIADGSTGVWPLRNPEVRITRGALGSFFMEISGVSQTPRVRRVK
ncbi:MAG: hypothetical protein OEU94_04115 [Aquincola sp.]|nr:hypothetical protein [Aquincola sp.]